MVLFRPNIQIFSKSLIKLSAVRREFFASWFRKNENKQAESRDCPSRVYPDSSYRQHMPQCPEHISTGAPSKCSEDGYGKPIKSKGWFSGWLGPVVIKQKPSNCAPQPCVKQETFIEYLFGRAKPLPDPNTCRQAYKHKQKCNANDPRLDDSRYQSTDGDVLLYTEPAKPKFCLVKGPQPKAPPPPIPPAAVVCKRYSDSLSGIDCYTMCIATEEDPSCHKNLCPVHAPPFRVPYEEMRPREQRKFEFFTCDKGIAGKDVPPPFRREACACPAITCSALDDTCDLHEALALRKKGIELLQKTREKDEHRRMSRAQRLNSIVTRKKVGIGACEDGCNSCGSRSL